MGELKKLGLTPPSKTTVQNSLRENGHEPSPKRGDTNYKIGFDHVLRKDGASVRTTAIRAPNENAYIERFVQTINQECLDHFLVFGEKHFNYLVREFVRYYHECRPHQGLEN